MSQSSLKTIINKLNNFSATALEAGVAFAAARRHYEVTVEHVLLKMLETGDSDVSLVLTEQGINQDKLWQALLANIDAQRAGNQGRPGFSPTLLKWLENALLANSLHYQQTQIRSLALFDALLEMSAQLPGDINDVLENVSMNDLHRQAHTIFKRSQEEKSHSESIIELPAATTGQSQAADTALTRFTHDITAKAKAKKIDPVLGRELEVRLMVDVLMRRRKNNPILVGEPGVGKTAIVEGFALRIANNDVPENFRNVSVLTLDLGLLQAGAGVKGEFEKRLQQVVEEVKASDTPIILFIDEAHTLIGAGGEAGGGDAANLLKPALARGELRTIAATTWAEYKQYFERDAALDRRFQLIHVKEPTEQQAVQIMSGLKNIYQDHHKILITDNAIEAAVKLSSRYITGRQLPDKAIDLIDTAAARLKISEDVVPSQIENLSAHKAYLIKRLEEIARDQQNGIFDNESDVEQGLQTELKQTEEQLTMLNNQWQAEKKLVDEIRQQRETIGVIMRGKPVDRAKFMWLQAAIRETQMALQALQESKPMLQTELNESLIADVVSDLTGVPVNSLLKDDISKLLSLEQDLNQKVIGQPQAITAIAEAIRTRQVGLGNPDAPLGVFMLTGPSGVGKTETARVVAESLFGGEHFLTTINMSEYQEAHTVSQLKGSPPGYVGYGEGGVLTEAVRQKPYSVLLLDEIEKAHPDVMNMFYQVFDRGQLRDGEGREINFRNTVIFMTSNLGTQAITNFFNQAENDINTGVQFPLVKEQVMSELQQHFAPALLARMQIFPYLPLSDQSMQAIAALKLDKLAARLHTSQGIQLRCDQNVLNYLATQTANFDRGARALNHLIEQQIEPAMAKQILAYMVDDAMPACVTLDLDESGELSFYFSADLPDEGTEQQESVA